MQWTTPTLSVGWVIAVVVLIATVLLLLLGQLGVPEALVIAAICAVRL